MLNTSTPYTYVDTMVVMSVPLFAYVEEAFKGTQENENTHTILVNDTLDGTTF